MNFCSSSSVGIIFLERSTVVYRCFFLVCSKVSSCSCHNSQIRHLSWKGGKIFLNINQNVNCHLPHVKYWMVCVARSH